MKFLLIYFTGTYNTRFLTDKLEGKLKENGHEIDRVEINCQTPVVNTDGYDFVGFSYPIYGFNPPRPFLKYFKKLKFKKGQKYFIYKNSGETFAMNNASSRRILRRMKRQKAEFRGEYHFVMPYNIHFAYDKNFVREILDKDEKLLQVLVHNIESGIVKEIKRKWIYNFAAWFVSIQSISGDVNSYFYRVDMDKCIKCGKCIKDCPQKNIYINKKGKIKLHHHCDMCMRCSFYCPTDAFKIGFLETWGWHVNGDYKLKAVDKDTTPYEPYINENSQGFYKCFIKTWAEIDSEYEKTFGAQSETEIASEVAVTDAEN